MQASNGKLYGVTNSGGAHNRGVLFEYDLVNSVYTNKYDFPLSMESPVYTKLIEVDIPCPVSSQISGPSSACGLTGNLTPVTYSIPAVPQAGYNWTVSSPNIVISTGQHTNTLTVTFKSTFLSGNITVSVNSACGNFSRSIAIANKKPATPGIISGNSNYCGYIEIDSPAIYSIRKVPNATSYTWSGTTGVNIISHPGGAGTANDTIVKVIFDGNYFALPGSISVVASSPCGSSLPKTLFFTSKAPVTPGIISGPVNVCPLMYMYDGNSYIGTDTFYTIRKIKDAQSYQWDIQNQVGGGAEIIDHPGGLGEQNDTIIKVRFSDGFVSASITISSFNGCGQSTNRTLALKRFVPAVPGTITGITNPCPTMGGPDTTTYRIKKVKYATSYEWEVPNGATIVNHPGGEGSINDTIIIVRWTTAFQAGSISVKSINHCFTSNPKTLPIVRKISLTPGAITVIPAGSCPNRMYIYSIPAMPTYADSVRWTVPPGATIISGQGTTSVTVSYPVTAVNSNIYVDAVNNCFIGPGKSLKVQLSACPATPRIAANSQRVERNTIPQQFDVQVFPNPSATSFMLKVNSEDSKIINISIMDMNGKVLDQINTGKDIIRVGGKLQPGMYFIKVRQGDHTITKKIIKL